jgi:leukotriene-A4 hydrolase
MLNAGGRIDLSSQSDPESCLSTNIHLDWTLDFEKKSIFGSATHSMTIVRDGCATMSFDSNGLIIEPQVEIITESSGRDATNVEISVGQNGPLGEEITISIPEGLRKVGSEFRVRFVYKTGPNASAVQWLDAASTAGKQCPYVFTQCQAIHARSLLPCMDSPGVKTTYSATVRCPLWCTVLMSALLEGEPIQRFTDQEDGGFTTFHFRQPVPTSAYLIALAAGRLESRDISPRVRIWSEPEVVQQAAFEFAETESFLKVAEELTIPYVWGRYDVLCLPPSFPYGGMENPCITFATPTLLAGDRSLADVIAHEIAHSWTGNLVTNVRRFVIVSPKKCEAKFVITLLSLSSCYCFTTRLLGNISGSMKDGQFG